MEIQKVTNVAVCKFYIKSNSQKVSNITLHRKGLFDTQFVSKTFPYSLKEIKKAFFNENFSQTPLIKEWIEQYNVRL